MTVILNNATEFTSTDQQAWAPAEIFLRRGQAKKRYYHSA